MSTTAVAAVAFLSSLGVVTHIDQGYPGHADMLQYTGVRNIRDGGRNLSTTLSVHQQTGVLMDLVAECGVADQLSQAKQLASAGALLSLEGANEPNNWPITFNGQQGGGMGDWGPVAQCQAALYSGLKNDPQLKNYPVFHVSEGGAETNNAGMQFLIVPSGAGTISAAPPGTKLADYANPHNYVSGHVGHLIDNMPWSAADPTLNGAWDGLYVEYGRTWMKGFSGYSNADLQTLPRVTTETGWDSVSDGNEAVQAGVLTNTYLAQFARGWRYTFIYEMVDGEGSSGAQGLYHSDGTAKPAATYIHNLTSILADNSAPASLGSMDYSISNQPGTVHSLLLQKSNGAYDLAVWSEIASGSAPVTVQFGQTFGTVKIYDVSKGTTPTATLSNASSAQLTLNGYSTYILEAASGTPTPPPAPTPSAMAGPVAALGGHALQLYLNEDAYQGDALAQISVNGSPAWPNPQPVKALHSQKQQQVFTVFGTWSSPPQITVTFTNDLYNGTPQTDRNMYLLSGSYDGKAISGASHSFHSTGGYGFSAQ